MSVIPIINHLCEEDPPTICSLCLEVPPMKGWNLCLDCYRAIRDGEEIDLREVLK